MGWNTTVPKISKNIWLISLFEEDLVRTGRDRGLGRMGSGACALGSNKQPTFAFHRPTKEEREMIRLFATHRFLPSKGRGGTVTDSV